MNLEWNGGVPIPQKWSSSPLFYFSVFQGLDYVLNLKPRRTCNKRGNIERHNYNSREYKTDRLVRKCLTQQDVPKRYEYKQDLKRGEGTSQCSNHLRMAAQGRHSVEPPLLKSSAWVER